MKLEVFATLDAVLRGGSFSAAAIERNLTPSSVSMQMKQLENHLGKQLFDRSGLQAKPLPLAAQVAAAMRGGLEQIEVLRQKQSVSVEGDVRLGIISSMVPVLLPGLLPLLRATHPKLNVHVVSGRSMSLTDAVKAGELDAAIGARPEKGGSNRLIWDCLERRRLTLLAPPDSTTNSAQALFKRYEWIRQDRSTSTGRLAAQYVNRYIPERRSTMELDNPWAIVAMVSAGLGVSVLQLSEPGMRQLYPIRFVRLPGAPEITISLVTRRADRDKRILAALREAVVEVSARSAAARQDLAQADGSRIYP